MPKALKAPPPPQNVKKYRIRGRNCTSLTHFLEEAAQVFDLTPDDWCRDLPSLRRALVHGGILKFPSKIIIYDNHYTSGEVDEWPDVLAVRRSEIRV